jgi:hypothetical protein
MVAPRARSDEGPAYASRCRNPSRKPREILDPLLQQHTHQEISPVPASPSTHHLRLVTMPSLRPGRLLKRGRGRDDERAARHFPASQDRRDHTGRNASMPGPSSSVYVDSTVDTGVLVVLTGRASSHCRRGMLARGFEFTLHGIMRNTSLLTPFPAGSACAGHSAVDHYIRYNCLVGS